MRRNVFDGTRVRKIREELDLSRGELAALSGVSPRAVSYTETGERLPGPVVIQKLAKGLGVSVRRFYVHDTEDEPTDGPTEVAS